MVTAYYQHESTFYRLITTLENYFKKNQFTMLTTDSLYQIQKEMVISCTGSSKQNELKAIELPNLNSLFIVWSLLWINISKKPIYNINKAYFITKEMVTILH